MTSRVSVVRRLSPAVAVLLAAACGGEPTAPSRQLSSPEGALFQKSGGPVLEQASGSGHFRQEGLKRTFAFNAKRHGDGTVSGEFQVTINGRRSVHGEILCLRIVGNEAWVGGRNPDGTEIGFRVVDNGDGGAAAPDEVSFHYFDPFGPGFSEWACASGGELPVQPIDAGNIQVRGLEGRASLVYANDFAAPVGAEWSADRRSTSPSGESFLGDFSDFDPHGVTLSLDGLPAHRYLRVSFDMVILRTMDGSDATYGLDLFTFGEAQSGFSFVTTFAGHGGVQAFPGRYPESTHYGYAGASGVNELGYEWFDHAANASIPMDAVYPVEFIIEHTGSSATLSFEAAGLQAYTDADGNFSDESWGIDNVRVQAIR